MQCIIHNAFLAGFLCALAFIRPLGAEPTPLTIAPEPFGEDTLGLTLQAFISSARESPDLEGLIELIPMKYSEEEIIDALSSGEIDIGLVTTEQIELRQDRLGPQPVAIFNQPAIFANIDEIAVVENSWLGDAALSELASANVLGLAYWNLGMTQFAANEPLANVEDFSGREIGTVSALKHEIYREFGAAPILLHSFDLGQAMFSRTADAVEISMEAAVNFPGAFTHIVEANYRPLVAVLAANREKWHSLPDQAQVALADLARLAGQQSIAIAARATEDARATLNEQGIMFTSLDAESRGAFREASLTTWREQPDIVADYLTDTLSLVEVSRTDIHRQELPGPPTPQSPQPRRGENLELEILFASDRNDERKWYPDKPIKPMFRMGSKRDHSERYCGIVPVKVDPTRPMANEDSKFFEIGEFELITWGVDGAKCRELLLKK
jgi:TRAP-type C4-dicarboxylate transport system substrate-binding protein